MKKIFILLILFLTCCLAAPAQEQPSAPAANNKEEKPLSVGIVVDNSYSLRLALDYVIKTSQLITNNLELDEQGFLVRFTNKDRIELLQDFTNNKDSLMRAADDMFCEGGATAIPEALFFSAKHLLQNGKNERKILILITDGDSKSDKKTYTETVNFLKENKIPVFIVGVTTVLDSDVKGAQKFLEKLASETGGTVVLVDRKMTPAEAANALIKAIRPNNNGKQRVVI
jgi:VWFA-related protein